MNIKQIGKLIVLSLVVAFAANSFAELAFKAKQGAPKGHRAKEQAQAPLDKAEQDRRKRQANRIHTNQGQVVYKQPNAKNDQPAAYGDIYMGSDVQVKGKLTNKVSGKQHMNMTLGKGSEAYMGNINVE